MIYIVGKLWILALIWHRAIEIWRILLAVRFLGTRPDCFVRMIRFFVLTMIYIDQQIDPRRQNETKALQNIHFWRIKTLSIDWFISLIWEAPGGVMCVSYHSIQMCLALLYVGLLLMFFSCASISCTDDCMWLTHWQTHRNWRLAILHVWQFSHHPSRILWEYLSGQSGQTGQSSRPGQSGHFA